jgi:hypothetical protein
LIPASADDCEKALELALTLANEHFHGNLVFKACQFVGKTRDGRGKVSCTLKVKDINEIGTRRAPRTWRKINAACWHAHGVFFDCLPGGTKVESCQVHFMAGDKWQDYNIGSMMYPQSASTACNCMEWNSGGVLPFHVNV